MTKKKEELQEFKTSAGNGAEVADPVTKGDTHKGRIADKGDNKDAMPKIADITPGNSTTPEVINYVLKAMSSDKSVQDAVFNAAKAAYEAGDATNNGKKAISTTAGKSIVAKEDIESLFGDAELSEEFKEKATLMFEAAAGVKAAERIATLEEEYAAKLEEEVARIEEEMTERLDQYLDHVATSWLEENALQVETGLRAEIAESFLTGLKSLFEDHYVEVPEDKTDILEQLASKVVDLEDKLNESVEKTLELSKKLEEAEIAKKFEEIAEGLSDNQKEKLKGLSEAIDFDSVEDFASKVSTLKESVFTEETTKVITEDSLNEGEVLTEEKKTTLDPQMAAYIEALSRTVKK